MAGVVHGETGIAAARPGGCIRGPGRCGEKRAAPSENPPSIGSGSPFHAHGSALSSEPLSKLLMFTIARATLLDEKPVYCMRVEPLPPASVQGLDAVRNSEVLLFDRSLAGLKHSRGWYAGHLEALRPGWPRHIVVLTDLHSHTWVAASQSPVRLQFDSTWDCVWSFETDASQASAFALFTDGLLLAASAPSATRRKLIHGLHFPRGGVDDDGQAYLAWLREQAEREPLPSPEIPSTDSLRDLFAPQPPGAMPGAA